MNRIIACAFSLKDVRNMIATVLKERPDPAVNNDEEEEKTMILILMSLITTSGILRECLKTRATRERLAKTEILRFEKGYYMAEELNTVTPEGADTSAPSFYEKIGNMKYNVVVHFAEKGGQTVKDRLKRGILREANSQNGRRTS